MQSLAYSSYKLKAYLKKTNCSTNRQTEQNIHAVYCSHVKYPIVVIHDFKKNKRHSLIQTVKNFNIQQRNLADKQVKYHSHVR